VSDKFALIAAEQADEHEVVLPVGLMCRALHVSRSGFYDWARAEPSARWLVFYGCFAGRGDRLEASARVTRVAVTREFVGLL
jgi:hypothetical protein